MNDLSPRPSTFGELSARATAEWPEELSLPRRDTRDGLYVIEGLSDLEEEIESRARRSREAALLVNLHWAAAHAALGSTSSVRVSELAHAARRKFHGDLADMSAESGWTGADLSLRNRYLQANAEAA